MVIAIGEFNILINSLMPLHTQFLSRLPFNLKTHKLPNSQTESYSWVNYDLFRLFS